MGLQKKFRENEVSGKWKKKEREKGNGGRKAENKGKIPWNTYGIIEGIKALLKKIN